MVMLNLLLKERALVNDIESQKERLKVLRSVKALLSQIDHTHEEIPAVHEHLLRLLTSLKGEPLEEEEQKLVYEITNMK